MKKLMMGLAGALFIAIIANAHPAEAQEGWEISKQNPVTLNPAASYKIARLFQLNLPDPPSTVVDRVITREELAAVATITLEGGFEELVIDNFYVDSDDIVFITGPLGGSTSYVELTSSYTFKPGAVFLFDAPYDEEEDNNTWNGVVELHGLNATGTVGAPNGEFVNFAGSLWIPRPDESPWKPRTGSRGLVSRGGTLTIHNAVFSRHNIGLSAGIISGNHAPVTNSVVDASNPYFINNRYAMDVDHLGDNDGDIQESLTVEVRVLNPYFSGNQAIIYPVDVTPTTNGEQLLNQVSVELTNAYFGPGQSPVAAWDTVSMEHVTSIRTYYEHMFKITEPTPTVFGEVRTVQTWPVSVPFAREDFDLDNVVGTSDLQLAAQVFGDSINAALFNWKYDLDEDLVVGKGDFRAIFPEFTRRSISESAEVLAADSRVRAFFTALEPYELAYAAVQSDAILGLIYDHLYPTAVAEIAGETPTQFSLGNNYPNPFNAETAIQYQIAEDAFVELAIYSMLGQRVTTLVSEHQQPGTYRATWDGLTEDGTSAATGIYVYRITAGDETRARRMSLLR